VHLVRPADVLLVGVALLAALFFVGAGLEAFGDYRGAARRRQRRRQRRRPVPSLPVEPGKDPADSPPTARPAVPAMVADVPWPARRPAHASPAPLHGTSGLSRTGRDEESEESVGPEQPDELEHGKMVVHYANGRVIKGYSYDFYPNKPLFHLLSPVAGFSFTDEAIEVRLKDLKAVFFVRDFVGDPSYDERKEFVDGQRPLGRRVAVTFPDGETLVGSTMGYDWRRIGFFLTPADPKSNNLKVFVISRTATSIRFL